MSEDPWTVLNLDRAVATERDVKAAYAKLLREHKPDQDPEGFQRVRAAYEAALTMVRQARDEPEGAILPATDLGTKRSAAVVPTPEVSPFDDAIILAIETLRLAVASRIRQKVRDAWAVYDREADRLLLTLEQRYLGLEMGFARNKALLAELITDAKLLMHIQAGEPHLVQQVVGDWIQKGEIKRLTEFCHALTKSNQVMASEFGAVVMLRSAIGLAAWQPDLANDLAHKAFPYVPASERTLLTETLDREVMLGRALAPLSPSDKTFWLSHVRRTAPRSNWRDEQSKQVLISVLRQCGTGWVGFSILRHTMPPEVFEDMLRTINQLLR